MLRPMGAAIFDAHEHLILARETHLDQLADKLDLTDLAA